MDKEIKEIVESLESQEHEDMGKKIILVGTHQGASMLMTRLCGSIKEKVKEEMARLSVQPQRTYPQSPKKGRKCIR